MDFIETEHSRNLSNQVCEAYQNLRSNVLFYGRDIKIIGITSCIPEKEKSEVSFNLAMSMAKGGKKVILVDADRIDSSLSENMTSDRLKKGLSNYLASMNLVDEIIYQTDIQNVDMILSGPMHTNLSELLAKERFGELMQNLKEVYDYIFVDTSPPDTYIDGVVAAQVCDAMILVVKAGTVSYKTGREATFRLEEAGCKVLGIVLLKGNVLRKRLKQGGIT